MGPNFLNLLAQGNGWMIAGLILLGLGLLALVISVNSFVGSRLKKSRMLLARRNRMGLGTLFFRLVLSLLLLFFAFSVFLTGAVLRTYTSFSRQELAGRLECVQSNPEAKVLVVRLIPVVHGQAQPAQTYTLPGDQWEINARILKWTPQANMLGLHTAYRLNLIKGVYLDAEGENQGPHQAYALSPGKDWVWSFLGRYGRYLPFVEAVYGNAVSNVILPGEQYEIYVTTSGLSAQKK